MSDKQPTSELWNRFLEARRKFVDAGDIDSLMPRPEILGWDMTSLELAKMDLSCARFKDCDFSGMNLESVNFNKCVFEGCDLSNTYLKGADLTRCFLVKADLANANLSEASLANANLTSADLTQVDLTGADLEEAILVGTDMTEAILVNADLSSTRASGAGLTEADLRIADLTSSDFSDADLTDANLSGANLSSTNLTNAQLTNVNFHGADLIKANLAGAVTLGMNVGGANLTNATLPDEVAKFEGIKIIEESSKLLRTLFLTLLSVVAFSLLTIASTTDAHLLTNSSSFKLPIIGTPVSIQQFYLIAPFGIGGIFIYFHLYLLKHYRLIAKLPAVFPDGTPFDERLHPWMFNTWVKVFFSKLKSQDVLADALSEFVIVFLGWVLVPTLMLVFMGRYTVHRSAVATELHFWLTIAALLVSYFLLVILEKKVFAISLSLKNKSLRMMWMVMVLSGALSLYFLPELVDRIPNKFTRYLYEANFHRQDVSIRPKNWDPHEPLRGVQGANLAEAILTGADGNGAFLIKADFRGANLGKSYFETADFRGASFHITFMADGSYREANFANAHFFGSMMKGSDFVRANFRKAQFDHANLEGAVLGGANLRLTRFNKTRMENAILKLADLKYAIFKNVKGLTAKQVKQARNWRWALYDDELRKELGITHGDLNIRLWQILKEQYPNFSREDREEKIREWMTRYGMK